MRYNPFKTHKILTNFTLSLLLVAVLLSTQLGELKLLENIAWLDVVGEGGIVLMTLSWILALLVSRPPGKVTTFLVLGLGLFMFSASLDLLDEWLKQPQRHWLSWIESLPAPIGMLFTTAGLCLWHKEQFVLNRQLSRREPNLRDHQKVCPITGLYRVPYVLDALDSQLENAASVHVAAIDIQGFTAINAHYGGQIGNRILKEFCDVLVINSRLEDLVTRLAGDCFIVVMPATSVYEANIILTQITQALTHCAFRTEAHSQPVYLRCRHAIVAPERAEQAQDMVTRAQRSLQQIKMQQSTDDARLHRA